MRGRGANKCHPIACACTDICSPDALLGSEHFTNIITGSIRVYGWLDSCLLFSSKKIVLIANFVQDILLFLLGGGRLFIKRGKFSQTYKLWNWCQKVFTALEFVQKQHFFKNNSVGAMIKPILKWWNQARNCQTIRGEKQQCWCVFVGNCVLIHYMVLSFDVAQRILSKE